MACFLGPFWMGEITELVLAQVKTLWKPACMPRCFDYILIREDSDSGRKVFQCILCETGDLKEWKYLWGASAPVVSFGNAPSGSNTGARVWRYRDLYHERSWRSPIDRTEYRQMRHFSSNVTVIVQDVLSVLGRRHTIAAWMPFEVRGALFMSCSVHWNGMSDGRSNPCKIHS
jgi:hypothetical protein